MKPRNFVAKNSQSVGAGPHKDKKRAAKNGDKKHREDLKEIARTLGYSRIGRGNV